VKNVFRLSHAIWRGLLRTARGRCRGPGGRASGYSQWRFESGDLMFSETHTTLKAVVNPDGTRKNTFAGTYLTRGGTGRLKGVKGLGRYAGVQEVDAQGKPIRSAYSAEGEYWFEK
jgi:hypothetical protein